MARRITRMGQGSGHGGRGSRGVKAHLGGFGTKVDMGACNAVLGRKHTFGARHTRGAAHTVKLKAKGLGHGFIWVPVPASCKTQTDKCHQRPLAHWPGFPQLLPKIKEHPP